MPSDFLEELAQLEVPAPPAAFDDQLHQRVNASLVVQQVLDLMLGAAPWAMLHFVEAVVGLIGLSVTGRYPEETKKN